MSDKPSKTAEELGAALAPKHRKFLQAALGIAEGQRLFR